MFYQKNTCLQLSKNLQEQTLTEYTIYLDLYMLSHSIPGS